MAISSGYNVGRFVLEVDGAQVGVVKQFSGLGAEADIVQNSVGGTAITKKHAGNVRWTPGRARVGLGMGKGLYGWLRSSMAPGNAPRDGVLMVTDVNYKLRFSLKFSKALITEFTVPRLDASNKEVGWFDVAFQAEQVAWSQGRQEQVNAVLAPHSKAWVLSNFKITIGGLPCAHVMAVEAFTWSATVQTDRVGNGRGGELAPAKVTVPDLKLIISAIDHPAWAEAARRWFVEGRRTEADEMQGRISLLGANMADELAFIELSNVGFKSFSHVDTGEGGSQRFTVELYVEKMQLGIKELGV